jgi:hypothetical protein
MRPGEETDWKDGGHIFVSIRYPFLMKVIVVTLGVLESLLSEKGAVCSLFIQEIAKGVCISGKGFSERKISFWKM